MKTYKQLYKEVIEPRNLFLAWRKARKGKTKKLYVIEFEKELDKNLKWLHEELKNETYKPKKLITFILRDPKTRKISKADFRDRIAHHAIVNILEPIFDKTFIYDSCANRKGKGNLFALKRFETFARKVSRNGINNGWFNANQVKGYCLKADIRHYFDEVNHSILLNIIGRKIKDEKTINLIRLIIDNGYATIGGGERHSLGEASGQSPTRGMPLGNLTSQFFANVYLNELDYFVKHELKVDYYIRYVDDFVILHSSKEQLQKWKEQIDEFLREKLKIELHPQKSRIISLSRGIDFVGFRNFYYYKLVRKRNIRKMNNRIRNFKNFKVSYWDLINSYQGWQAYVKWANSFKLRRKILKEIHKVKEEKLKYIDTFKRRLSPVDATIQLFTQQSTSQFPFPLNMQIYKSLFEE
ncbi:MAG: reverse transcriptase domain-containing protein [Nanoarchaeota archaeon]